MSNYVKSVVFDMINYLHQKWMKVDQPIADVFRMESMVISQASCLLITKLYPVKQLNIVTPPPKTNKCDLNEDHLKKQISSSKQHFSAYYMQLYVNFQRRFHVNYWLMLLIASWNFIDLLYSVNKPQTISNKYEVLTHVATQTLS